MPYRRIIGGGYRNADVSRTSVYTPILRILTKSLKKIEFFVYCLAVCYNWYKLGTVKLFNIPKHIRLRSNLRVRKKYITFIPTVYCHNKKNI